MWSICLRCSYSWKLFQDFLAQSVFKIKHLRPITHCTPSLFFHLAPMPKHLLRRRKGTELSLIQFLRWVLLSFDNEIVTMASARDDPRIDIVCMWSQSPKVVSSLFLSCFQFVPKLFPVCLKVIFSLSQSWVRSCHVVRRLYPSFPKLNQGYLKVARNLSLCWLNVVLKLSQSCLKGAPKLS